MLAGRTALVTGSVGGIGLAVAHGLAGAGARLMMCDIAEPAVGERRAAEIAGRHGVEVSYRRVDLADPGAIARLMAEAGGVDVLVNNAVIRHFAPVEAFAPEDWEHSLAVNLSAAFHTIRLAMPHMKAAGWGRIVNMASVLGFIGTDNRVGYVTTKTALIGLTRAVATETLGLDITCNAICPGAIETPTNAGRIDALAAREGVDRAEATRRYLADRQPSGRFVEADSIAALVVFLCSPAGRDMTGTALPVDTGWLAGTPSSG